MTKLTKRYAGLYFITAAVCLGLATACGPSLPPATAGGGFSVETMVFDTQYHLAPNVRLDFNFVSVYDRTSAGDPSPFSITTNSVGYGECPGRMAPATWDVTWVSGGYPGCSTAANNPYRISVGLHRNETIVCYQTSQLTGTSNLVAPDTIYTQAPPVSVTIYGSGFTAQYGMPVVQYFDSSGTLMGQTTATSIGDGTYIVGPVPDLSQTVTGSFVGLINNVNSSGGLDLLGAAAIMVVAHPGYMTMNGSTMGRYRVFTNFIYYDEFGRVSNIPITVSNGGQGYPPGTDTYTDQYGHTIQITFGTTAKILVNGTWETIPLQFLGNI